MICDLKSLDEGKSGDTPLRASGKKNSNNKKYISIYI